MSVGQELFAGFIIDELVLSIFAVSLGFRVKCVVINLVLLLLMLILLLGLAPSETEAARGGDSVRVGNDSLEVNVQQKVHWQDGDQAEP